MRFDVVIVGDFRFPGGTSTSVAAEIEALSRGGYSVALVPLKGGVLKFPHFLNGSIKSQIERKNAVLVPPDENVAARLCLLHHPQVFMNYPQAPLRVEAEQTILVAHHPPVDGDGRPSYDVSAIDRIARDLFGELSWAPVGPKVRQAFAGVTSSPKLFAEDWLNIINVDAFRLQRDGFLSARPVIGRHSRPDPLKWPDTKEELLQAYPASPDIRVRFLGGSKHLEERVGGYPSNWEVLEFGAADVKAFLGTIDFFVYFHSEKWIEAFGRSILEAIASGAVAILPPSFEPLFGDAAIYCAPSDVTRIVSELHADPAEYARQSARGVAYVSEHFGLDQGWRRVERLLGKPNKTSAPFFEGSKKN